VSDNPRLRRNGVAYPDPHCYGGEVKMKSGGGIHIKAENKGKLHREMGIPAGKKIPLKAMKKAEKGASPAEEKRLNFAINARGWNK
jgi:hypothetical protein